MGETLFRHRSVFKDNKMLLLLVVCISFCENPILSQITAINLDKIKEQKTSLLERIGRVNKSNLF